MKAYTSTIVQLNAPDSKSHAERVIVIAIIKKKEHEGKIAAFQPNRTLILTCIHIHTYVDVYQHTRARLGHQYQNFVCKTKRTQFYHSKPYFRAFPSYFISLCYSYGHFFHFIKQDPL